MDRPFLEVVNQILAAGWRRRFLIIVPLIILPLIGSAAAVFGTKQVESRMTILVQEPAKLNPFLADLAVGTRLKERIPVLESLARSPLVLGEALRELNVVTAETSSDEKTLMVRRIASSLTIDLVGSDLVELRLRGTPATNVDSMLAVIGRMFIEKLVAPERSSIAGSVKFLDQQMNERRAALNATERRLADFKTQHSDELPELHAANFQRLASLRQLLEERRSELAGAAAAADDLRETLGSMNPLVGHLQDEIVRLTGELAMLHARYTDDHSAVQAVSRQLRRLEDERSRASAEARAIVEEDFDQLWNQAVGTQERIGRPPLLVSQLEQLQLAKARRVALEKEVAQLERTTNELEGTVAKQSRVATELAALDRDLSTEQEVYGTLLKRFEMARVTGDLGTFEAAERVIIIQTADRPSLVSPPPVLYIFASVVGGLALGLGLAVASELADDTVRGRADLARIGGLRLLARIPRFPADSFVRDDPNHGQRRPRYHDTIAAA